MSMPALQLRGVAKLYGRTAALRALDLTLEPGRTLALLGPNGSGKTTLLKILAGATGPTLGSGEIYGHDLRRDRYALRSMVGILAADSYLYDDLTARENLDFILTMAGRRPDRAEVRHVLSIVSLDDQADARARTFSSGMRRRLSLARVLLLAPRLLLLDEPYNSLDSSGADLIDRVVRTAAGEGRSTLIATHDAERALALCDQVLALDRGRVIYYGSVEGWRAQRAQYVG